MSLNFLFIVFLEFDRIKHKIYFNEIGLNKRNNKTLYCLSNQRKVSDNPFNPGTSSLGYTLIIFRNEIKTF